jgi:hypothetical protein
MCNTHPYDPQEDICGVGENNPSLVLAHALLGSLREVAKFA